MGNLPRQARFSQLKSSSSGLARTELAIMERVPSRLCQLARLGLSWGWPKIEWIISYLSKLAASKGS
jgi:hypothetical protein